MQQIITKMKSNGVLDINPDLLKRLTGKQLKIIYDIEKESKTKDAKDFIELLRKGPKIKLKEDNLTREFLYRRDDNGYLYR
jgi:hypothetical protein